MESRTLSTRPSPHGRCECDQFDVATDDQLAVNDGIAEFDPLPKNLGRPETRDENSTTVPKFSHAAESGLANRVSQVTSLANTVFLGSSGKQIRRFWLRGT